MFTFAELLHPITPDAFRAEYDGRKPLHIPAGTDDRKRAVLDWAAFNGLLNQPDVWTPNTLLLMRDHVPVPAEQYCSIVQTPTGGVIQRLSMRKVEVFLSAGSSLVGNAVQNISPLIARLSAMLSREFAANVGANIYCSFAGVQAFGTHYDTHDVFAIQTEGEKVWRLYQNRAENPVEEIVGRPGIRQWIEQNRGPLMTEVHMRPGDVLYLPRGWYHDALARDGESLHLTLSITPLTGAAVLNALHAAAMQDPVVRGWLPPADQGNGEPLKARIAEVMQVLSRLAETPALIDEIAMAQNRTTVPPTTFTLPLRKPVTLMRTTGMAFPPTTALRKRVYDWAGIERRFALEDLIASFDEMPETEVRDAVDAALAAGALTREQAG